MKIMFNISNHPSAGWSDEQRQAALKIADEIVDVPFPNVDPTWEAWAIDATAKEIVDNILDICEVRNAFPVCHVMGEMTLTFNLVNELQNTYGYHCYASTTKRDVVEKDGVKTSVFKFVKFRRYV